MVVVGCDNGCGGGGWNVLDGWGAGAAAGLPRSWVRGRCAGMSLSGERGRVGFKMDFLTEGASCQACVSYEIATRAPTSLGTHRSAATVLIDGCEYLLLCLVCVESFNSAGAERL